MGLKIGNTKTSFCEIRNLIQNSLKKRPMNIFELSQDTKVNIKTVKKHVEYLRDIHVVRKSSFRLRKGEATLYELIDRIR